MGTFKIIRQTDGELNYLFNAVNYITNKNSYDISGSPNVDTDNAYFQMLCVKKYFQKTSGNPLFHFVIVHESRNVYDESQAVYLSKKIAEYFKDRYQVIWSVHRKGMKAKGKYPGSKYHTHLLINSVSYVDGKMYAGNQRDIYGFLEYIKQVTRDKKWIVDHK